MELFRDLVNEFSAVGALLLFLPFFALRNQQRPLQHVVGGLAPFQAVSAQGQSKQKKRPISFWLFLLAYSLAAGCLYAAQHGQPRTLILVDQSPSALRAGVVLPEGESQFRVMGGPFESVLASDLVQEFRGVGDDTTISVWTDLEPPNLLPAWVQWQTQNFSEREEVLGVLLHAQPVGENHWRVHWALQENVSAMLECGDWQSEMLLGESGSTVVPVTNQPHQIQLRVDGKLLEQGTAGASLTLPKVDIQIPEHADSAWEAVALSSWPSAQVTRGLKQILFVDGQAVDLDQLEEQLPWEREPQPEELALFAKRVRSAIQAQHPPRDVREFLPQPQVSAARYELPTQKGWSSLQAPGWLPFVVFLGCVLAALAWFRIPHEGKRTYSEV